MTASVTIRFDESFKKEIDNVSKNLGVSTAAAFTIFAKQYVSHKGFPFPVMELPSEEAWVAEMNRRYDDIMTGKTKPEFHNLIEK